MGMFGDAGQAIDSFFDNLFTSEPQEWERQGFNSYKEYWLYQKPDKSQFTSPIFPGGFDQEGYDQAYYEWMKMSPDWSMSGE